LEALIPGRTRGHGGTAEYSDELRERAVKMVLEIRERTGRDTGEIARVARQLDVRPEALPSWPAQAEIDGESVPAPRRRIGGGSVRELRRANEIVKAASAYFAQELGPGCRAGRVH
jgi:transposase